VSGVTRGAPLEPHHFRVVRQPSGDPDLTVVMPVYDQERYVGAALRSVLDQRDVVLEVIVSDDASSDATWERVVDVAGAYEGRHGLILRRGPERLRRDHLALLIERASSDLVIVAHGDDVSSPSRAAAVLATAAASGAAVVGATFTTMGPVGPVDLPVLSPAEVAAPPWYDVGPDDLIRFHREFTGAVLALRRSALGVFPRLDQSYAACGHDSVLPFRGALAGGAVVVDLPLICRRQHDGNWSKSTWDGRRPEAATFGASLTSLSALRAMASDLGVAATSGLVDAATADRLRRLVEERRGVLLDRALDAHDQLVREGRSTLWATEHETNLAWRGDLSALYARSAAVRELLQAGRRLAVRIPIRRSRRATPW
jgi:Glycosyl transferase family 2